MHISSVVIQNLGPFGPSPVSSSKGYSFEDGRHVFALGKGSVGIFGENGVGKTTFVDLVYAAITNDFKRFDGTRADCVNSRAEKNAPAFVELEMIHEGCGIQLSRGVRNARFSLKLSGDDRTITSPEEAAERLERIGISRKILDFCCFKRQPGTEKNSIDDFLRTSPTVRAEAYMALNQTEHCSVVYDGLGEVLNKDADLNAQVVDDSDEIAADLARLASEKDAFEAQLEEHEGALLKPEHEAAARKIVERHEKRGELVARRDKLASELEAVRESHKEARDRRLKREARAATLAEEAQQKAKKAEDAAACLQAWVRWEKYRDKREALEAEKRNLASDAASRAPVKLDKRLIGADEEEMAGVLALLKAELETSKQALKVFGGTGLTACPTCGTPVEAIMDELEAHKAKVERNPAKIAQLTADLAAIRDYRQKSARHKEWEAAHAERVAANARSFKQLEEVSEPEVSRTACKTVIAQADLALVELKELKEKLADIVKLEAVLSAKLEEKAEQLSELDDRLAEGGSDESAAAFARRRLKEHAEAQLAIATVKGRLQGIKAQAADKKDQLEKLRKRIRKAKKMRQAAARLARVRDAFHKTALPQKVAQANLALMVKDVNENLEAFGSPFWVEPADDLSFLVHKPGEPPHRAERLSGGQKVVLALAFWPAVNSLYRSGLGLMVLDEPTANLDEANIAFLRDAMSRLTGQVRGRRQVLMISHAESLKPSFDQVIELERPA